MKKTLTILIFVLATMAVLIGVVSYLTDGFVNWNFESSLGQMSLYINDVEYVQGDILPTVDTVCIKVVGVENFKVEIVTGPSTFDFRHNGALVKFPYVEGNFDELFGLSSNENSFCIKGNQRSIKPILEALYPGEEITDISAIDEEAIYFVVRVSGGGQTVDIPINGFYEWMSVELDKSEIIF